MSERNLVLLVNDIFRHLYAQSDDPFNQELQRRSQQLLQEIQHSRELKAVVSQVTIDDIFRDLQAQYGVVIARSVINALEGSGLEILPTPYPGKSVRFDDANSLRAAEIKSAIDNHITELITHFPSLYSSVLSSLSVVAAWELLNRLLRERLEQTLQNSNILEQTDQVHIATRAAHFTATPQPDSPVQTMGVSDVVALPGAFLGNGVEAFSLLLVIFLIYILAILSSLTAQTGKYRSEAAAEKGIPGLGMMGVDSLLGQSLPAYSDFQGLGSTWAALLLLAAPFLAVNLGAEVGRTDRTLGAIAEIPTTIKTEPVVQTPQPGAFQAPTSAINSTAPNPLSRWEASPLNQNIRLVELAAIPLPPEPQVGYSANFFDGLPGEAETQANIPLLMPSDAVQASDRAAQPNGESPQGGIGDPGGVIPTFIPIDPLPINAFGGNRLIDVQANIGRLRIEHFGGVGRGVDPSPETIAEVDTLVLGANLTLEKMLLTQIGNDLEMTFEDVENTTIVFVNFQMELLDNLEQQTGALLTIGNLSQADDRTIQDRFDVVNREWNGDRVFNRNTVTFLNDLNNIVMGFWGDSNDVINGQGGNDVLFGLDGDDMLRGGAGNDVLIGGAGNNLLVGSSGSDFFVMERGGFSRVKDFSPGQDWIGLPVGATVRDVQIEEATAAIPTGNATSTLLYLQGNPAPLMELMGVRSAALFPDLFLPSRNQWLPLFQQAAG